MALDSNQKAARLRELALGAMDDPHYAVRQMMSRLQVSQDEVLRAFLAYNLDATLHTNDLYRSLPLRITLHLHNLIEGSWHQERQETAIALIRYANAQTAVDVGFGIPQRYVKDVVLKTGALKLTLADLYDEAFSAAGALLEQWDSEWQQKISFKKHDMDTEEYIGDFGLYMFFDSVEHTRNPTEYLTKAVQHAPSDSQFLLSLPIGAPTGAHHITWYTVEEAREWLAHCGLEERQSRVVYVNPDIDLFAQGLDERLHNYFVLCQKKR